MSRGKYVIAACVAWGGLAGSVLAGPPAGTTMETRGMSNRQVAREIASAIARAVPEQGYSVDLEFRAGTVTLHGVVSSTNQMNRVVAAARAHSAVVQLTNGLTVKGSAPVKQAGLQEVLGQPQEVMIEESATLPQVEETLAPVVPEYTYPSGAAPQYDMPFMPSFSWPATAPYPNYSAVQYPKNHAHTEWPYVGPFHPYPEAPLDWREVKLKSYAGLNPFSKGNGPPPDWQVISLRWDDGHWYLQFKEPWWNINGFFRNMAARYHEGSVEQSTGCNAGCLKCMQSRMHVRFKQPLCAHPFRN